MKTLNPFLFSGLLILALAAAGCGFSEMDVFSDTIALSPANQVPALAGNTASGSVSLRLSSSNLLTFSIVVDSLDPTDNLLIAHIHRGNPVENGDVLFDLVDGNNIVFNGNTASGEIQLSESQVNALLNDELYVNVHSSNVPTGLLRGPVGKKQVYGQDIPLAPLLTSRSETGLATLRLMSDGTLYSLITVNNLKADDQLQFAHVHYGPLASGGAVMVDLCTSGAQFGVAQKIALTAQQASDLQTAVCYINCHSSLEPAGFLGAQLR